jgi:hypothetical protein
MKAGPSNRNGFRALSSRAGRPGPEILHLQTLITHLINVGEQVDGEAPHHGTLLQRSDWVPAIRAERPNTCGLAGAAPENTM